MININRKTFNVDPLSLNSHVAIGISLPLNGSSVFNQTYNRKEQTKYNLLNYVLTNKGEKLYNLDFGGDIRKLLFENDINEINLKNSLSSGISKYVPNVRINNINIDFDNKKLLLNITINYSDIVTGINDEIIINFT
jgi:hypothetical protein